MKKLLLLPILLLFISCSPQKRLDNLLKKHPELAQDSVVYNLKVVDTTIIEYSYKDTVVTIDRVVNEPTTIASVTTQFSKATAVLNPDRTIRLVSETEPQTIEKIIEKKVNVPKIVVYNKPKKLSIFQKILIVTDGIVWGILITAILSMLFFRIFKK